MAAGLGQKIEAQDYNNIRNIINPVIGRNFGGTASVGYDNSPSATAVAADTKISATQWNNLRLDISRGRGHQTGTNLSDSSIAGALTVPNPSAQFTATGSGDTLVVSSNPAPGIIQVGSVLSGSGIPSNTYTITAFLSGVNGGAGSYRVAPATLAIPSAQTVNSTFYRQISENDRSLYATMAQAVFDNRIITPPASIPAVRRTQANLVGGNQQRLPVANGGGWNGIIRQTITLWFPEEISPTNPALSGRTARAYFNSGSQFLFSAVFAPADAQTKNLSWQTLCSNMGTIRFGLNTISDSGDTSSSTATIQAYGFSNLPATGSGPSSTQLLYTRTITFSASGGNVGNYNPNRIRLYGKKVTASNIDTFTFVFEFDDAAAADTPPAATPPYDTPIDELVNGTLTTTIQAEYASDVSYISVTPPSGNTTGIV